MLLPDLAATEALASRLARRLGPGDAVLLEGPLGAGKSAFARALIRAAAEDPSLEVPSPTFTLVQSYATPRGTIHHFDLWRLAGPADLTELGWDQALADIVVVEWPERLGGRHPAAAVRIALAHAGGDAREARITGWDPDALPLRGDG